MILIKMKNIHCDSIDLQDMLLFFDTIKNCIIVREDEVEFF